jgi:hypothetical protein
LTLTIGELERIKRIGSFAETLRIDESFRDVVRGLKDDAIRGWADAKSSDKREDFWHDLQAVGRLEQKLKDLGEAYRVEMAQIEAIKKKQERMNRQREAADRGM